MHRLTLVLLATVFLGLVGCGDRGASPTADGGAATPALERVRLQLNWVPEPEFGGIYAAQQAGFFREEGLEVEIIKGGPGVAAPQLAAAGQVEFAVVGGEQILTLREQGGELVGLFAIYQDDPLAVMVHESSPHRSLVELWRSNATIACETNLSWVRTLEGRLGKAGLRFVPHTGSLAEFAASPERAQQCFLFAEPIALELQGIKTRVFLSKESGFNPYNAVVATGAAYLRDHPDTCDRLARALQRGWARYLEEPGPTNELMASLNTAMSREAMDLAAKRQMPLIRTPETDRLGLGAMTTSRWAEIAGQLQGLGTIKSVPDVASVYRWPEPTR